MYKKSEIKIRPRFGYNIDYMIFKYFTDIDLWEMGAMQQRKEKYHTTTTKEERYKPDEGKWGLWVPLHHCKILLKKKTKCNRTKVLKYPHFLYNKWESCRRESRQ